MTVFQPALLQHFATVSAVSTAGNLNSISKSSTSGPQAQFQRSASASSLPSLSVVIGGDRDTDKEVITLTDFGRLRQISCSKIKSSSIDSSSPSSLQIMECNLLDSISGVALFGFDLFTSFKHVASSKIQQQPQQQQPSFRISSLVKLSFLLSDGSKKQLRSFHLRPIKWTLRPDTISGGEWNELVQQEQWELLMDVGIPKRMLFATGSTELEIETAADAADGEAHPFWEFRGFFEASSMLISMNL